MDKRIWLVQATERDGLRRNNPQLNIQLYAWEKSPFGWHEC